MEENNNIDDIFRSALDDMKMEPSAKNWDALSTRLSAKRAARLKKRSGLWFSAVALLLIFSYTTYRLTRPSIVSIPEKIQTETSVAPSELASADNKNENSAPATQTENNTFTSSGTQNISDNSVAVSSAPSNVKQTDRTNEKTESAASRTLSNQKSAPYVATSATIIPSKNNNTVTNKSAVSNETNSAVKTESTEQHAVNSNSNSTPATQQAQTAAEKPVNTSAIAAGGLVTAGAVNHTASSPSVNRTTDNASQNSSSSNSSSNEPVKSSDNKSAIETNEVNNSNETGNTGSNPPAELIAVVPAVNEVKSNEAATPAVPSAPSENVVTTASSDSSKLSDYAPQTNPEQSKSVFKRILSNLGAEVYYTPEYAETKMEVNNDYTGPASKNLDDYKNETSQYCYSTGINLQYKIGSKWSILSGIQSSEFAKTAVYNSISVVADSVFQEEYVDPNGSGGHSGGWGGGGSHHWGNNHGGSHGGHGHSNPDHPNDPNSNHHYVIHTPCGSFDLENAPPHSENASNGDTLKVKTEINETVHFTSIPLIVRYSFGTKKLSYFAEAGGAINYVTTDKVKIVVNDATSEDGNLNSLSNINYTLLFGFGANYNFYKGLGMFLKPSLRYSVTPINVDSPVNSYPYYLGVSAGISIHF